MWCGRFEFGVVERKAVVVFGGNDAIFSAAFLDELGPGFWVVVLGCKTLHLTHVFRVGYCSVVKSPAFRGAIDSVHAPMNENAEFGIGKPRCLLRKRDGG